LLAPPLQRLVTELSKLPGIGNRTAQRLAFHVLRTSDLDGISEVVLATNPTTTGEATALHIAGELHQRAPEITVTRLASGLPVGGDLEYADEVTLGRAFSGRRAL
jgi:recombination protein RecR